MKTSSREKIQFIMRKCWKKTKKWAINSKERYITQNKPSSRGNPQFIMRKYWTNKSPTNNIQRQKKNIKTDLTNEEKLAQKKNKPTTKRNIKKDTQNSASNAKKRQATIEKTHNVGKQHEKQQLTQKCWKTQTAVKNNRTKRRNRRTQQTQSRQPPDNDKMTDKRSKPTKPRTKRAINGMKEKYHRKTSHETARSARGCPEPPKPIFTAERHINGRNIAESARPRKVRRMKRKKKRI